MKSRRRRALSESLGPSAFRLCWVVFSMFRVVAVLCLRIEGKAYLACTSCTITVISFCSSVPLFGPLAHYEADNNRDVGED